MNMNVSKSIHTLLHLVSAVMFLVQLNTAVKQLFAPEFVVTTETLSIKSILAPDIMICPVNQYNATILKEFGFSSEYEMFHGMKANSSTRSWATKGGMAFEEMIEAATNNQSLNYSFGLHDGSHRIFYPRYGYCFMIKTDLAKPLAIENLKYNELAIFITDASKKTYFSRDIPSQTGNRMDLKRGTLYSYSISVTIKDMSHKKDSVKCRTEEDYKYSKCVDAEVHKDLLPILACIPPWLSKNNHCLDTDEPNSGENLTEQTFIYNYSWPFVYHQKTVAELRCSSPCVQQIIQVVLLIIFF